MNEWQIASMVFMGSLALFGFSFTVFSWIISRESKKHNDKMDDINNSVMKLQQYMDATFARKDTHAIELSHIIQMIELMNRKMDTMIEKINNKIEYLENNHGSRK